MKLIVTFLHLFIGISYNVVAKDKTRLVHTKYGSVQGFKQPLGKLLGDVEVFLGVPYASAPIGEGRFTPTNTPTPWDGVKDATQQPSVCPQLMPDVDASMTDARSQYIRKIRPILLNQSEDCLTLSIYSPYLVTPGSSSYPVLVYIHGESFSWGAGSLYDGSILAAHGRVVVVTINYRLGPLGFLNSYPGSGSSGVASNFALLDQIAALSWLADNVGFFHGDSSKVTLIGRDTGAACITYLMESPVMPPGLFHRSILLSGGSWSPWASVSSPLSYTIKLALTLECPVPKDRASQFPPTVACLRSIPLHTLMAAARTVIAPTFTPAWGPSEDGVVVANAIRGKQSRDLMIGFTPWEGWTWLPTDLYTGVDNSTFTKVARTLIRNTRRHHLRAVLAAALQEYTDWSVSSASDLTRRDLLLKMLGDSMLVAPLHQAADEYSIQKNVFVLMQDFSNQFEGSFQLPGWELGLLWGMGLSEEVMGSFIVPPFPRTILAQLSEDVITLITNFAKSGDPNLPRESPSPGFAAIAWPKYHPDTRNYLKMSIPPLVESHYRAHELALWTWLVPELEAVGEISISSNNRTWEFSDDSSLFYGSVRPVNPWGFLDPDKQNEEGAIASGVAVQSTSGPFRDDDNTPRLTTTLALSPTLASPSSEGLFHGPGGMIRYSTALLGTLVVGISLLILNAIVFGLVIWKKPKRLKHEQKLYPRQPPLQSVSGEISEDQTVLNMVNMSPSDRTMQKSAMSKSFITGNTSMQMPVSKKNNLKKKGKISSASYNILCTDDKMKTHTTNLRGYNGHQNSATHSCNSPIQTFDSGQNSYNVQYAGERRTPMRTLSTVTLNRRDHRLSRRQSVTCLDAECNLMVSQDLSGSMTLPRQSTQSSRYKQTAEGLSSKEGSSSLFDLSNGDVRLASTSTSSQMQCHSLSHQQLVPNTNQNHQQFQKEKNQFNSHQNNNRNLNSQQTNLNNRIEPQEHISKQNQIFNRHQHYQPNYSHQNLHHQQKKTVGFGNSYSVISKENGNVPPYRECNLHYENNMSPRNPSPSNSDHITPYSVFNSCPPEFQNEMTNEVSNMSAAQRVASHVFHHRNSPSGTPPPGISTQLKAVATPSPPPSHQKQEKRLPRSHEKRVTIVEEGMHRL